MNITWMQDSNFILLINSRQLDTVAFEKKNIGKHIKSYIHK